MVWGPIFMTMGPNTMVNSKKEKNMVPGRTGSIMVTPMKAGMPMV